MAKSSNYYPGKLNRRERTAPVHQVIELAQPIDCFDLRTAVSRAAFSGVREIELRALYADYREPTYDAIANGDSIRLCDFLLATHLITQYGYHIVMESTDAYLSFGRKAVTVQFEKDSCVKEE